MTKELADQIEKSKLLVATNYYRSPKWVENKQIIADLLNVTVINNECFVIVDPAWNKVWVFTPGSKGWKHIQVC